MDVTINQRFSDVIKMCIELNLVTNKADFGDKIGVKASRISEILGERMGVNSEICRDVCRLFDINLNWLLTGEGEMRKNSNTNIGDGQQIIANHVQGGINADNRRYYSDSPDILKAQIDDKDKLLREKDERLREKDEYIVELKARIQELKNNR